jgi:thymidine kinase
MLNKVPGKLEVICGSMFSGKTEELMYRLRRAEYAKKNVVTIKHKIDNRMSYSCIVSHDGGKREAYPVSSCEEGLNSLMRIAGDRSVDVVGIDEIQFFPEETISIIQSLVDEGVRIIVAGLDLDFRGEPFGIVPVLMALADEVTKIRAVCMECGNEANFTQRLINGKPASYDDETILVGGEECYEPRCRQCYQIDKKAYTGV